MTRRRAFLRGALAAAIPPIAGCTGGDDGGRGDAPRPTDRATPTPTPTEAPTATPTPTETAAAASVGQREYLSYDWGKLEGADPQPTTEIMLESTAFHPLIAAVPRGASVSFANEDSFGHTVTLPALDVDEQIGGGGSASMSFDDPGTYDYVCTFHPPGMLGRLVVTEETPTPSPTLASTPTPTATATPTLASTPTATATPTPTSTPTATPTSGGGDDDGYY